MQNTVIARISGGGGRWLSHSKRTLKRIETRKMSFCGKFEGFTLAEVLITLGIIGIVAAMTIPNLIAKHRKKVLHTEFLKAYSDIQNAAKRFQADEGITVYEYSQNVKLSRSDDTLLKLMTCFKGTNEINNSNLIDGDGGNAIFNRAIGYTPKNIAGNQLLSHPCDKSIFAKEIGGRYWSMDDPVSAYNDTRIGPKICVDTNGKKGPNIYGYDWFVFVFTKNNSVKPFIGSDYLNLGNDMANPESACNYTYSSATYTCAHFAVTDTSPLDPSKKYWTDFLK